MVSAKSAALASIAAIVMKTDSGLLAELKKLTDGNHLHKVQIT